MERTLIIDQSSSCCGYAVIQAGELLEYGTIEPTVKMSKAPRRLREMYDDLQGMIERLKPTEIVLEEHHLHGMQSTKSIKPLAGATNICEMAADKAGIPVYFVRPQRWKAACGAKGKKEVIKQDVLRIVCRYWGINESDIRSFDQSDALGMAACWKILADDLRSGK